VAVPQAIKDEIVRLAANGYSRSAIASQVGNGLSRCAISGLLHRMQIRTGNVGKPKVCKQRRTAARPAKPVAEVVARIGVSLTEISDHRCHWPIAGAGISTLFCNADRANSRHPSYCSHHHARSIRIEAPAPATRRRLAMALRPMAR
jgi:hypothetical protein